MTPLPLAPDLAAAVAAQRFGLGEPGLESIGSDARGWLLSQIDAADAQRGRALPAAADGLRAHAEFVRLQRQQRSPTEPGMAGPRSSEQQFGDHFRPLVQADLQARLLTAATTRRPFVERIALFWANHFTVSQAKASLRGLVGAFEREAIRPHIAGPFQTVLKAAVTHPAMLRYLDNDNSAGPTSPLVRRLARLPRPEGAPGPRITGLNENLARELLELHTLGAASGGAGYGGWGGYTQSDVGALARLLTGWRVVAQPPAGTDLPGTRFDPLWHEPGEKSVLGKAYPEGAGALDQVLHDLTRHPSTARFVAAKLARHFVADTPPPALVARLAATFTATEGDLASVYRELVLAPESWDPAPTKFKTPEEFVVSSLRLIGIGESALERPTDLGIGNLGQRVQAAPSPAGWPDRAEDWLGPDAVWKRVEWATRLADGQGRRVDARALARLGLGARLGAATAREIDRAADGPQALALLLLAPEHQRR